MKTANEIIRQIELTCGTTEPNEIANVVGLSIRRNSLPDGIDGMYTQINNAFFLVLSDTLDEERTRYLTACGLACKHYPTIQHVLFDWKDVEYFPVHDFAVKLITYGKAQKESETVFDFFLRTAIPPQVIAGYRLQNN